MKKDQSTKAPKGKWLSLLKKNWFNLIIVSLLLYVFLNKDFSMQVNLNAPAKINQPVPESEEATPIKAEKQSNEVFTEKTTKKRTTIFDKFEMPYIGSRSKKIDPAYELDKVDEKIKQAYLKRFAHVAISEQKKFGIPASITLANALLHSYAGQRPTAKKGNNQFGIRCTNDWEGEQIDIRDNCYRRYGNAWMSFRDHSNYLRSSKFKTLRKIDPADYKAWAKALEKDQFSDFDNLSRHLINIIKTYGLAELDG